MRLPTPAPFAFAQVPPTFLGRTVNPSMPAQGGYTRDDLERMRFALSQSGADPAMLQRVETIIGMRRDGAMPVQPQMLRPSAAKQNRLKRTVSGAVNARQSLLDALSQRAQ
jgi:hypothetical protein